MKKYTNPDGKANKLTRRGFVKIAGAGTGILAVSATGYTLFDSSRGESPPILNPYTSTQTAYKYCRAGESAPILLVTNARSVFSAYYAEILGAEGFNCFHIRSVLPETLSELQQFAAIILSEGEYGDSEVGLLKTFVQGGGGLLVLCPGDSLAALCGVRHLPDVLENGYIQTDTRSTLAEGITSQQMQFHGRAQSYLPDGADVVAWVWESATIDHSFCAVTIQHLGRGVIAMWAFDLARSIVLTRQGNPQLAKIPDPRWDGLRAVNMFVDWIDLDRIQIPQADEQQRLFGNMLSMLVDSTHPLPRIWYFPHSADSMIVATGDSHLNPHAAIQSVVERVESFDGHISIYYSPLLVSPLGRAARRARSWMTDGIPVLGDLLAQEFGAPTPKQVQAWRERGHEFTLHTYVERGLQNGWNEYWHEFTGRGFGPISETTRTHRVLWDGWVETAKVQASYGIRMNLDYYHWGPLLRDPHGEWLFGYFTGSGLPMRFVDEEGRILEIFQTLTNLADDHMLSLHWGGVAELPPDKAVEVSQSLLQAARTNYPSAIITQFHVDPFEVGGEFVKRSTQFIDGILGYAAEHAMPILSAEDWLHFTRFRREIDLLTTRWVEQDCRLVIDLSVPESESPHDASLMIPAQRGGYELRETLLDDMPTAFTHRRLGNTQYGCIPIKTGNRNVIANFS